MYSNNTLNFRESTTILNACTKKFGNLLKAPRILEFWKRGPFLSVMSYQRIKKPWLCRGNRLGVVTIEKSWERKRKISEKKITVSSIYIYMYIYMCVCISMHSLCNGYRRWKWIRRLEFKFCTRLFAYHIPLIVWRKVLSLQFWVNSEADQIL